MSGTAPSRKTLAGCALAFGGVAILLTAGADSGDIGGVARSLTGDGLIAGAAALYSAHVVRLGAFAPRLRPIDLARAKEIARLGYSSALLVGGLFLATSQVGGYG